MAATMERERAIDRLKRFEIGFREFLILLFFLAFLAAFCYWCYELWFIHTTNFDSATDTVAITEAAAHEAAAFQACILAFLFIVILAYVL